jgi:lipopolysaccharide export system permease protein
VFWGTIHRMILIELLKIFFLALVALTGLILLAGVISEATKNGFGPAQILACIPLLLPSLLPYTLPTTTLFATCIVYGRLAADNEILALKSAGVHIIHVVWPALFLGLATSAVTIVCYLDVIPYTGYLLRNPVIRDVEELLYGMLRRDGCIQHPKISWEINVKAVQGRKLQDVIFRRKSTDGNGFDTIAWAKEAELRVDLSHKLILVDMRQCDVWQRDGAIGFVESRIWEVEIVGEWGPGPTKIRAMDMSWAELFEYERVARQERQEISHKIDLLQAENGLRVPQPNDDELVGNLLRARKYHDDMIFSICAELHMRPALALGCLCFALVGCPIGIWFSKSDYLSAFITCFLPIVIVYYPLMFCMFDMARAGKIPSWMGIFNADALMLLTGGFLFRRLTRN